MGTLSVVMNTICVCTLLYFIMHRDRGKCLVEGVSYGYKQTINNHIYLKRTYFQFYSILSKFSLDAFFNIEYCHVRRLQEYGNVVDFITSFKFCIRLTPSLLRVSRAPDSPLELDLTPSLKGWKVL